MTTYRIGTSHFRSKSDAVRYYAKQDIGASDVQSKLDNGEIRLGAPQLIKPNESLTIDQDGRYIILVIESK